MSWTFAPNAIVDTSSGPPVAVQALNEALDKIIALNIPLKHLKKIANAFDRYVEVEFVPLKKVKTKKKRL